MQKVRILLAEDDPNLGTLLKRFLSNKGFDVQWAQNGHTAFEKFGKNEFDLCVFDVMMPEMDGFQLTTEIRKLDKNIPVIFLTAKSMPEDILNGFSVGADDYVRKPFEMEELVARIKAVVKRSNLDSENENRDTSFTLGITEYDPEIRMVKIGESEKKLTTKENQLLHLLAKNQNEILDRQATLRAIWGEDNYFNGRSMDVYIAKLRKILKDDPKVEILNEHGKGFKLVIHD